LWARLECAPTDSYEGLQTINQFKSKTNTFGVPFYQVTCGIDEFTDKCDLFSSGGKLGVGIFNWCTDSNLDYNCDSGTSERTADSTTNEQYLFPMNKGDKLLFWCETHLGINVDCKSLTKKYRPWGLYRFEGGRKDTIKSNTCKLTDISNPSSLMTSTKNAVVTSVNSLLGAQQPTPVTELTMTGGDGYKWLNFVHDFAYGPAYNIFKYNGQDVYCTGSALWTIQNMQMKDGKLIPINPEYNPPSYDPNGQNGLPFQIQTIGSKIKNVECCSSEPNCDANFMIVPDKPNPTCFTDAQCQNAGNGIPTSPTSYVYQKCVSGTCQWQAEVKVECTSNLACTYPKVCDKLNWRCISPDPQGYCGDNTCNRDETKISCPADCGAPPSTGMCTNCLKFAWNWLSGNQYCAPKPADKVFFGLISVPLSSQSSICPLFLLIMFGLLGLGTWFGYGLYKKNKRRK
ncbi:MAG: hypothetical protein AABY22_07430, partial [Nanoarchaeota archaeon]